MNDIKHRLIHMLIVVCAIPLDLAFAGTPVTLTEWLNQYDIQCMGFDPSSSHAVIFDQQNGAGQLYVYRQEQVDTGKLIYLRAAPECGGYRYTCGATKKHSKQKELISTSQLKELSNVVFDNYYHQPQAASLSTTDGSTINLDNLSYQSVFGGNAYGSVVLGDGTTIKPLRCEFYDLSAEAKYEFKTKRQDLKITIGKPIPEIF